MNRTRDPKGIYIKSKSDLSTKVPSDLFGGRNIPLINSADRYQKIGVSSTQRAKVVSKETKTGSTISSTQRAKVVSEETKTGSTIEHKIEASIIVGQKARPLKPSVEPTNTPFFSYHHREILTLWKSSLCEPSFIK
jgi:hypothetical protein